MAILNNRLTQEQYDENFTDIHPPFESRDAALTEVNRCLFCYDAPCTKVCPTSIDVPKFIKQINTGNIKGSAFTILSSNILGGGCARVCPVEKLCEGSCVLNKELEKPIQIARLQRYSTDMALEKKWNLFERKSSIGRKVAVVGAGPAGLSCAHGLSRQGIDVTIYEKEGRPGGLMTYGIAAYKVTPEFCQEETDFIVSLGGIEILYNQELGKNLSLVDLQKNYDAVFLGIGVGLTRQLEIPGENLEGVVDAIRFIYGLREEGFAKTAVGDQVAVIGMGMTAIDAATQAKRLGAKEVTLVYRRTENEKPCTDVELEIAKLDGCQIIWLASPKEIISENGKVKSLVCSKMEMGAPDESGRRFPFDTGETFALEIDMVIKATGQVPYADLLQNSGIELTKGKIRIDANNTSNMGTVFAGGDCVNGGKEVVDAVQAGKEGAKSILKYLGIIE
ncbi:MAG: pyridine nucleotide-disulfide oxidoreductase [Bacteroidetes bacterium HGW-Bacteroidetes-16]|jgi:glutamate synthase (NADPH/NADH) small chain|nr:MAG: pyridine nucleotide-disulfide oxidoreductase [Bacteroidetes bacterium HGW-Bacteroidetes-16]